MTHEWKDFSPDDGPMLPLSSAQQAQLISGVMPSGEEHFFDRRQDRSVNPLNPGTQRGWVGGSGINSPFPHPNPTTPDSEKFLSHENPADFPNSFSKDWWEASGILKTYPESPGAPYDAGTSGSIFEADKLKLPFSNSDKAKLDQIEDFTIFNDYIHHYRLNKPKAEVITIPYISSYFISSMKFVESFSANFIKEEEDQENDS
tara:strand:+ start:1139 stop:1747 length:609 start_codon:yes stop_codon:yes gene_type:complete